MIKYSKRGPSWACADHSSRSCADLGSTHLGAGGCLPLALRRVLRVRHGIIMHVLGQRAGHRERAGLGQRLRHDLVCHLCPALPFPCAHTRLPSSSIDISLLVCSSKTGHFLVSVSSFPVPLFRPTPEARPGRRARGGLEAGSRRARRGLEARAPGSRI